MFTGPIDAYYASQGLPKLEYRSLRFFESTTSRTRAPRVLHPGFYQPCLQLNYPGPEVDFTRIVEYKHKPNQPAEARASKGTVIFKEFSCDHGEPYYPVPNPANHELFKKYQELAMTQPRGCAWPAGWLEVTSISTWTRRSSTRWRCSTRWWLAERSKSAPNSAKGTDRSERVESSRRGERVVAAKAPITHTSRLIHWLAARRRRGSNRSALVNRQITGQV